MNIKDALISFLKSRILGFAVLGFGVVLIVLWNLYWSEYNAYHAQKEKRKSTDYKWVANDSLQTMELVYVGDSTEFKKGAVHYDVLTFPDRMFAFISVPFAIIASLAPESSVEKIEDDTLEETMSSLIESRESSISVALVLPKKEESPNIDIATSDFTSDFKEKIVASSQEKVKVVAEEKPEAKVVARGVADVVTPPDTITFEVEKRDTAGQHTAVDRFTNYTGSLVRDVASIFDGDEKQNDFEAIRVSPLAQVVSVDSLPVKKIEAPIDSSWMRYRDSVSQLFVVEQDDDTALVLPVEVDSTEFAVVESSSQKTGSGWWNDLIHWVSNFFKDILSLFFEEEVDYGDVYIVMSAVSEQGFSANSSEAISEKKKIEVVAPFQDSVIRYVEDSLDKEFQVDAALLKLDTEDVEVVTSALAGVKSKKLNAIESPRYEKIIIEKEMRKSESLSVFSEDYSSEQSFPSRIIEDDVLSAAQEQEDQDPFIPVDTRSWLEIFSSWKDYIVEELTSILTFGKTDLPPVERSVPDVSKKKVRQRGTVASLMSSSSRVQSVEAQKTGENESSLKFVSKQSSFILVSSSEDVQIAESMHSFEQTVSVESVQSEDDRVIFEDSWPQKLIAFFKNVWNSFVALFSFAEQVGDQESDGLPQALFEKVSAASVTPMVKYSSVSASISSAPKMMMASSKEEVVLEEEDTLFDEKDLIDLNALPLSSAVMALETKKEMTVVVLPQSESSAVPGLSSVVYYENHFDTSSEVVAVKKHHGTLITRFLKWVQRLFSTSPKGVVKEVYAAASSSEEVLSVSVTAAPEPEIKKAIIKKETIERPHMKEVAIKKSERVKRVDKKRERKETKYESIEDARRKKSFIAPKYTPKKSQLKVVPVDTVENEAFLKSFENSKKPVSYTRRIIAFIDGLFATNKEAHVDKMNKEGHISSAAVKRVKKDKPLKKRNRVEKRVVESISSSERVQQIEIASSVSPMSKKAEESSEMQIKKVTPTLESSEAVATPSVTMPKAVESSVTLDKIEVSSSVAKLVVDSATILRGIRADSLLQFVKAAIKDSINAWDMRKIEAQKDSLVLREDTTKVSPEAEAKIENVEPQKSKVIIVTAAETKKLIPQSYMIKRIICKFGVIDNLYAQFDLELTFFDKKLKSEIKESQDNIKAITQNIFYFTSKDKMQLPLIQKKLTSKLRFLYQKDIEVNFKNFETKIKNETSP